MDGSSTIKVTPFLIHDHNAHVHATEFIKIFNRYSKKIKVLSLDCFGTLLWRKFAAQKDIFYAMQQRLTQRHISFFAEQRILAEKKARQTIWVRHGRTELTLRDIYQIGFPFLSEEQQNELIEEEIAVENDNLYAFPPILNLIQHAYLSGKKIVVTVDTYYQSKQIRHLLNNNLPTKMAEIIEDIFCSCDYAQSKSEKLYHEVITKLAINNQEMLHIGQDVKNDFETPCNTFEIPAFQFIQYEKTIDQLSTLYQSAALISNPLVRHMQPLVQPFQGLFATQSSVLLKPEALLGYISLGPIIYAFAHFIFDAVKEIELSTFKKPKILYLLRDGYLPAMACESLFTDYMLNESLGKFIYVSRFAAIAASFNTENDIENFFIESNQDLSFSHLCQQLLLPDDISISLIALVKKIENKNDKYNEFIRLVLEPNIVSIILKASTAYRKRLKMHLIKDGGVEADDHVLLIDIGYNGSIQNLLTPLLQNELGVKTIHGRYLIALNTYGQFNRRGLIDSQYMDARSADILASHCSLIESLFCSGDNAVINYDDKGNAKGAKSGLSEAQLLKIKRVQAECLRFISEAKNFFTVSQTHIPTRYLQEYAIAELTRQLYFPTEYEINYLQGFQHDGNHHNETLFTVFRDPIKELARLRNRGISFKQQHPYALRYAGIEYSLALLAHQRFNLSNEISTINLRKDILSISFFINDEEIRQSIQASITYDGYYSLSFPVKKGIDKIAILIGLSYQLIQIECIQLINTMEYEEVGYTHNIADNLKYIDLVPRPEKLFECRPSASIQLTISAFENDFYHFKMIYRPIVKQSQR